MDANPDRRHTGALDAAMGRAHQNYRNPYLDISARPLVGLLPPG